MPATTSATQEKPFYRILYVQVPAAIMLGVMVGWLWPDLAKNDWIKSMGDGFVKLIKLAIAPIIFCTVVSGIAHISEVKKVGRVAVKALVYFEIVSTFALALGLIVANVLRPGAGFQGQSNAAAIAGYAKQVSEMKSVDFVLHMIRCSAPRPPKARFRSSWRSSRSSAAPSRWSAWSFRPATRSTWTGPTST